ncbi:MAG TPA: acetolactate synthase [Candidatus Dormibacteraeota bacterium]|nr:acetolactate synthase [Candidatus Dormibacteraeota bacterium]
MADALTTGDLVARALAEAGGEPIFTLNGGHIWGLYLGAERRGIRMIDVRHEQTAGFAAEGWAKVTRRCGVAAVTAGPGVTNAMSAIAAAQQNDSPVLFLGGRAPVARWGMGSLQELDHVALVRSLTKSAATVEAPEAAYGMTVAAITTALGGRTGPTFLDVPIDVLFQSAEAPARAAEWQIHRGELAFADDVRRIAALLRESERPAIVAGGSVWWARAEDELLRLAEAAGVPVVLNGMARGMLPPDHALFATRARGVALGEADLVLAIGVPLDFRLGFGQPPAIAEGACVVYIDVEEDGRRQHRPAAATLHGELKTGLAALAEAVRDVPHREAWQAHVAAANRASQARDAALAAHEGSPVHPARLVAEVERYCDEDAIIVGDGGDFVSFAGRLIHRRRPGLWVDGGPYGCLGSGPGYALAAKLAHPDRQVVLLSGDGAFGFSAIEFDTLVRHRVPVVCVVGNNGIWALEKHPMQRLLGTSLLSDLAPGTRYDKVVEALGGHGELVDRPEEIGPALDRAFRSGLPACVNVLSDPDAEYPRSSVLM